MKKYLKLILILTICLIIVVGTIVILSLKDNNSIENDNNDNISFNKIDLPTLLKDFNRKAKINKTTLYDDKNIVIVANNIYFEEDEVIIEISVTNNNSSEISLSCGSGACDVNAINRIMISDGFLSLDVEANETEDDTIEFEIEELIANGISEIADIDIGFWVSGDNIDGFYTGPLSIKTTLAENHNYSKNTYQQFIESKNYESVFNVEVLHYSGEVNYKKAGIEILSVAIIKNNEGEILALFEIKNTTDENVNAWGKETYINDEFIQSQSSWIKSINGQNTLIATFSLSNLAKKYNGQNDLSKLNKFKFTLATGKTTYTADNFGVVEVILNNKNIEF